MKKKIQQKILCVIRLISKRRWCIIIPFCLIMIGGFIIALFVTKEYEATVYFSVTYNGIPGNKFQAESLTFWPSKVNSISQSIKSLFLIKKLIDQNKVLTDQKLEKIATEDMAEFLRRNENMVEFLRRKIKVKIVQDVPGRGLEAIGVSFQDENPMVATHIAKEIVNIFINELVFPEKFIFNGVEERLVEVRAEIINISQLDEKSYLSYYLDILEM